MFGRGDDYIPTETRGALRLNFDDHTLDSDSDPRNADGIQEGVFGMSPPAVLDLVLAFKQTMAIPSLCRGLFLSPSSGNPTTSEGVNGVSSIVRTFSAIVQIQFP